MTAIASAILYSGSLMHRLLASTADRATAGTHSLRYTARFKHADLQVRVNQTIAGDIHHKLEHRARNARRPGGRTWRSWRATGGPGLSWNGSARLARPRCPRRSWATARCATRREGAGRWAGSGWRGPRCAGPDRSTAESRTYRRSSRRHGAGPGPGAWWSWWWRCRPWPCMVWQLRGWCAECQSSDARGLSQHIMQEQ